MEKIFDELSYATPKHLYAGAPVEEIKALSAQKSQDYQANKLENDKLDIALNNLDVRDVDYNLKKQKIQQQKEAVKNIVENGDWQNAKQQVVQQAKNFATDKEIQAMTAAKQAEQAHNAELNKEVEENKKSKEWAAYEKAISSSTPITKNPDGTISGGYGAAKVLNDKEITQQIAKEAETFINDYKADKFQVGGNTYQSAGNGEYFVNGTRKTVPFSEVKSGLIQDLKNRHGDFLQQEKNVHMYQLKGGTDRPIDFKDLQNTFGITDENSLLKRYGVDNDAISDLEKDPVKNAELIRVAKDEQGKILAELKKPEGASKIYNSIYDQEQANKYTNPYANKAAYTEDEQKWELNHGRIEAIKAANERANIKFKNDLEKKSLVPLVLSGNTESFSYTPTDLGLTDNLIQKNKEEMVKKQALMKEIEKDPSRAREYDKLKAEVNDLENTINSNIKMKADYIDNMGVKAPEVQHSFIAHSLIGKNNSAGLAAYIVQHPNDFSPLTVQAANTLNKNMTNSAVKAMKNTKKVVDLQGEINEKDFKALNEAISIDKNKNRLLNEAVRIVEEKGDVPAIAFKKEQLPTQTSGLLNVNAVEVPNYIKSPNLSFSQAVENNQAPIIEQSKKVFGIDRNTDISSKQNRYIELMTDLVKNGSSTFLKDGKDYGKYITNLMANNELKDAKGKPIKEFDGSKVMVNPVINYFTGIPQARVTIPNAYTKGKEGQLVTANFDFDAADTETTNAYFKQVGQEQLQSSNPEDKAKGISILSYLDYGKDLARMNTTKDASFDMNRTIHVPTSDGKQGQKTIHLVKKEGQEGFNAYNMSGAPITYGNNKNGEYSSPQELQETLYKIVNNL